MSELREVRLIGTTETDGSLTVTAPTPTVAIAFNPASFSFTATEGGANPSNQTLDVWNSSIGTL
ncbi:hypothetical protein LCGC14_2921150, partial [marine sediment metagenome]